MSMFVGDRAKEPKQLNVAAAVDLGSELASEGFLLSIAVILLLLENKRSSNKDKQKEEKIKTRFHELEDEVAAQKTAIEGLQAQLERLADQPMSSQSMSFHTPGPPTLSSTPSH